MINGFHKFTFVMTLYDCYFCCYCWGHPTFIKSSDSILKEATETSLDSLVIPWRHQEPYIGLIFSLDIFDK